jgi:hypothetical protein
MQDVCGCALLGRAKQPDDKHSGVMAADQAMVSAPCSFENLSAGNGALVIDLTSMAGVRVNVSAMTATVQLGARHGNMYHAITTAGRAVGRGNLTSLGGVWTQVCGTNVVLWNFFIQMPTTMLSHTHVVCQHAS